MKTIHELLEEAILLSENNTIELTLKQLANKTFRVSGHKVAGLSDTSDFSLTITFGQKIELQSTKDRISDCKLTFDSGSIKTYATNGAFFVKLSGKLIVNGEEITLKKAKFDLRRGYGEGDENDVIKLLGDNDILKAAKNKVKYGKDLEIGEIPVNQNIFIGYSDRTKLVGSSNNFEKDHRYRSFIQFNLVFDDAQINAGTAKQLFTYNLNTKKFRIHFKNAFDVHTRKRLGKCWFEFNSAEPIYDGEIYLPLR